MQIACDVAGNKSNCFQFVGAGSNILPSGMEEEEGLELKKKQQQQQKTKTALIRVCQLVRHCDQSCENVFTAIAKSVFVSLTKIRDSTNFYHTTIW